MDIVFSFIFLRILLKVGFTLFSFSFISSVVSLSSRLVSFFSFVLDAFFKYLVLLGWLIMFMKEAQNRWMEGHERRLSLVLPVQWPKGNIKFFFFSSFLWSCSNSFRKDSSNLVGTSFLGPKRKKTREISNSICKLWVNSSLITSLHITVLKVKVKSLSHVQLFATPWTVAYQAPLSMRFSRQ